MRLIISMDDVGFGQPSTFDSKINTPHRGTDNHD
jgi:arylsulfatase A-like enzyme